MNRALAAALVIAVLMLALASALPTHDAAATWPTNMVTQRPPRTATPAPSSHAVAKGVVVGNTTIGEICGDVLAVSASWYQTGWDLPDCPFIDEVGFIQWNQGEQGNGNILLVWNEPDRYLVGGGWKIEPCLAAQRWHDVIEPGYPDHLLASPGVNFKRGWIEEWWACYESTYSHAPRLDYLAVHCYSTGQNGRDCLAEFTQAATWGLAHGLETIASEYAALVYGNPHHCEGGCPDCQTEAQGLAEAARVLNGIKTVPGIVAVAWYNTRTPGDDLGAMDCNSPLFDGNGELTVFGQFYRDWQ